MEDEILEKKKKILRIASDKYCTRVIKYRRIKNIVNELSNEEKNILYNEFKRDYETYGLSGNIKDIVSIFMSSISLIVATESIYLKEVDKNTNFNVTQLLLFFIMFCSCILIFLVGLLGTCYGKKRDITKYIISFFEEK